MPSCDEDDATNFSMLCLAVSAASVPMVKGDTHPTAEVNSPSILRCTRLKPGRREKCKTATATRTRRLCEVRGWMPLGALEHCRMRTFAEGHCLCRGADWIWRSVCLRWSSLHTLPRRKLHNNDTYAAKWHETLETSVARLLLRPNELHLQMNCNACSDGTFLAREAEDGHRPDIIVTTK